MLVGQSEIQDKLICSEEHKSVCKNVNTRIIILRNIAKYPLVDANKRS